MSDLSSVSENYFPTAHETFADTLSSSIAALATEVPITNLSEYDDGEVVVLTVEPGTSNEATCVGVKASSPYKLTSVVWTEGNVGVGHSAGATVIDYDSATHYNLLTKWLKTIANQDGTLKDQPIRDALGLSSASVNGWETFPYTMSVTSGYNKGNKSFEINVAGQDVTNLLSPGMRIRLERGTAAPDQCPLFDASSSQYAAITDGSQTGLDITTDYTGEAWINVTEVGSTTMNIFSKRNGSSGYDFTLDQSGHLQVAFATSSLTIIESIQSVMQKAEGDWVHIAVAVDISARTAAMYVNGALMPSTTTTSGNTTIGNNTSDFVIGANSGAKNEFMDGKISDVRLWSDIRTATEIQDNMNQQLTGSETGLVGYWKLDGDFTDSTSNGNDLTTSGGVVATNNDNPMKGTEYGIVTDVEYSSPNSTVTVFTGNSNNIPNMTLTSPFYSTVRAPFGFPAEKSNWRLANSISTLVQKASPAASTWYNETKLDLVVPKGKWTVGYEAHGYIDRSSSGDGPVSMYSTLSETTSSEGRRVYKDSKQTDGSKYLSGILKGRSKETVTTPKTLTFLISTANASMTNLYVTADRGFSEVYAECEYL